MPKVKKKICVIECDSCGNDFEQDVTDGGRPRGRCYVCGPAKRENDDDAKPRSPDESPFSFKLVHARASLYRVRLVDEDREVDFGHESSLADAVRMAKKLRRDIYRANIDLSREDNLE